jgi:hypothetical protein
MDIGITDGRTIESRKNTFFTDVKKNAIFAAFF